VGRLPALTWRPVPPPGPPGSYTQALNKHRIIQLITEGELPGGGGGDAAGRVLVYFTAILRDRTHGEVEKGAKQNQVYRTGPPGGSPPPKAPEGHGPIHTGVITPRNIGHKMNLV
jgi:hypothetical protein